MVTHRLAACGSLGGTGGIEFLDVLMRMGGTRAFVTDLLLSVGNLPVVGKLAELPVLSAGDVQRTLLSVKPIGSLLGRSNLVHSENSSAWDQKELFPEFGEVLKSTPPR